MYSSSDLNNLLKRLDCEVKDRGFKGLCKLCGNKSLALNSGKKKPVIVHCHICGVDRKAEVIKAVGLSWDDLGPEMSMEEIDKIWMEVNPNFKRIKDKSERLQLGSNELLHSCYSYLLKHEHSKLYSQHLEWLESRGLSKPSDLLYASTPETTLKASVIAEELYKIVGEQLFQVPGFIKENSKPKIRINEAGIFHPTRNLDGQILVVKIRKPKTTNKDKIYSLSSSFNDGPSSIVRCHIPLGVNKLDTSTVWITEGERKADVIFQKLNVASIGVPGAQNIKQCLPELEAMKCKEIVMAMDKDKAGEYATINLRYEHEIQQLGRTFFYCDWETPSTG